MRNAYLEEKNFGRTQRGIFTLDVALAALIVLFLIYFSSSIIASLNFSMLTLQSRDAELRLLLLSNQLVRTESYEEQNGLWANVISIDRKVDVVGLAKTYGFSGATTEISSKDPSTLSFPNSQQNTYCIERVVLALSDFGREPAILRVCAW